jgi:hypothetical protein
MKILSCKYEHILMKNLLMNFHCKLTCFLPLTVSYLTSRTLNKYTLFISFIEPGKWKRIPCFLGFNFLHMFLVLGCYIRESYYNFKKINRKIFFLMLVISAKYQTVLYSRNISPMLTYTLLSYVFHQVWEYQT